MDNPFSGRRRDQDLAVDVAEWDEWWTAAATTLRRSGLGLVLSGREVAAAGISRQRTRTLLRHGSWTAAGYGYVAPLDVRDPDPYVTTRRRHALACVAATRRRPDHVVGGRSAAIVRGLPTLRVPDQPELTAPQSIDAGRRSSSHVYPAGIEPADMTRWLDVPLLTPARTLVDLGRHDRRDAIMAVDAALAGNLIRPCDVRAALHRARGWPGVRQARGVLALADPRSESPLESLTRLALHESGFPAPDLQVPIPGTPYRVDMLWPQLRVILEVDGLAKYTDAEWRREKRRELRLRGLGYRVERVGWDDVVLRWPDTERWLRRALRLPGRVG